MCGRPQEQHSSCVVTPQPMGGAQDKNNGYILPGPRLQGRHRPPCIPQTYHGQTYPLSHPLPSNKSSIHEEQTIVACLATMWGSSPLPLPATPVFLSQAREVGQLEEMHCTVPCQARGKATGKELWPFHTWGHSWENKLAISIAHLPATQLGLGLNLLST